MAPLEQLATRVANYDQSAEAEIYSRLSRPIYTMLRVRTGDPDLAQDLSQETFRILIEKLRRDELKDKSKLSSFTHGIALNVMRGYYRSEHQKKTDVNTDEVLLAVCVDETSYEKLLRQQEGDFVREMLAELRNQRDREILDRAFLLDEDKESICLELDLSPTHYDRVIHRAKQRLRKMMEQSSELANFKKEGLR